jgi:TM2 domain-containing membrane protein YozV
MSVRPRNKTLAVWLATLFGSLGIHRFYLRGVFDWIGWLHPIAAALGWWGVERVQLYGQDDKLSWVLIPFLGASIAVGCLAAIVYALTDAEKWNHWFNADHNPGASAGKTNWLTIAALVFAMLLGTIAFMGSLAFVFQHYFEYQVEEARKISQ